MEGLIVLRTTKTKYHHTLDWLFRHQEYDFGRIEDSLVTYWEGGLNYRTTERFQHTNQAYF